jgi:hypothetical protein
VSSQAFLLSGRDRIVLAFLLVRSCPTIEITYTAMPEEAVTWTATIPRRGIERACQQNQHSIRRMFSPHRRHAPSSQLVRNRLHADRHCGA